MVIIKHLTSDEKYIRDLPFLHSSSWTEDLEGESVLEIQTTTEVEQKDRLLFLDPFGDWHEFIVQRVTAEHGPSGIIYSIFAENSIYETLGDWIDDRRLNDAPARTAVTVALETSRFDAGTVDDLGRATLNFYRTNARTAMQRVTNAYGGEMRTRVTVSGNKVTGRFVDLLTRVGADRGKRFEYGRSMNGITREIDTVNMVTALHGFGKGEEIVDDEGAPTGSYGRRITFAAINNGKTYVENTDARDRFGRLKADGSRAHIFGKIEFDEITDANTLIDQTIEELAYQSTPKVNYSASVLDFAKYGLDVTGAKLGDTVRIIDRPADIAVEARIIKFVHNLTTEEPDQIELGNFRDDFTREQASIRQKLEAMLGKAGAWDAAANDTSPIPADRITGLLEAWNDELNSGGGFVYSNQGGGIITYDRPEDQEPTKAIQVIGGAIRISNRKDAAGNWIWTTIGTGDGFAAEKMFAGTFIGDVADLGYIRAQDVRIDGSVDLSAKLQVIDQTSEGIATQVEQLLSVDPDKVFTWIPEGPYKPGDRWLMPEITVDDWVNWSPDQLIAWGMTSDDLIGVRTYVAKRERTSGFHRTDWALVSTGDQLNVELTRRVDVNSARLDQSGLQVQRLSHDINIAGQQITDTERRLTEVEGGKITLSLATEIDGVFRPGPHLEQTAEHIKIEHQDGSYTMMSYDGVQRFTSGTGESYLYKVRAIPFSGNGYQPVRIEVPEEFRGTNFRVVVSGSDSGRAPLQFQNRYVAGPHYYGLCPPARIPDGGPEYNDDRIYALAYCQWVNHADNILTYDGSSPATGVALLLA